MTVEVEVYLNGRSVGSVMSSATADRPEAKVSVGNEKARMTMELFDKSVSDEEVRRFCGDAVERMLQQKRALGEQGGNRHA